MGGKWLWYPGLLDSIIKKEKAQESHNRKLNQLENDLQFQEQFLQDQDTEMWVSKDAMWKYPTMWWRPTKLIGIFTLLWIAYWTKELVDYWLNSIDKGNQQEEIINNTQKNIQNALVVDSTTIIDYYKEDLSIDELEKFEQLSPTEQRKYKVINEYKKTLSADECQEFEQFSYQEQRELATEK